VPARRFPPPWTVEDIGAAFVVTDSAGQKLAYVYFEDKTGPSLSGQAAHARRGQADSVNTRFADLLRERKKLKWFSDTVFLGECAKGRKGCG
jgi:hypothetical protein